MAELLVAAGAVASVSQIAVYLSKSLISIQQFCESVSNAPHELDQIRTRIKLLHAVLKDLQDLLPTFQDDDILPPDLRNLLHDTIRGLLGQVERAHSDCRAINCGDLINRRKRLVYVIRDRQSIKNMLKQLKTSDQTFLILVQYLNA
jgi:DNA repair ATPase RecN